MSGWLLTLNGGSSSLKFALFRITGGRAVNVMAGQIEGIGTAPHILLKDASGGGANGVADRLLLNVSYWDISDVELTGLSLIDERSDSFLLRVNCTHRCAAACAASLDSHQYRSASKRPVVNRKLSRDDLSPKSTGLLPQRTHC